MISERARHGEAARPYAQGAYWAALQVAAADFAASFQTARALRLVVIQPVVAAHLRQAMQYSLSQVCLATSARSRRSSTAPKYAQRRPRH